MRPLDPEDDFVKGTVEIGPVDPFAAAACRYDRGLVGVFARSAPVKPGADARER